MKLHSTTNECPYCGSQMIRHQDELDCTKCGHYQYSPVPDRERIAQRKKEQEEKEK